MRKEMGEGMFWDERINAEQGRAFRLTVIVAWALTVLYGIAHLIYLIMASQVLITSLSVELFCGLGGFCIIAYGEFNQWSDTKDEMWKYEKNKYYSKAFYWFLYILLFSYCCIRVPAYIVNSSYDMPPNQLLILLELTGFIVLVTKFKLSAVSFNYTFISEGRRSYGAQVFINTAKLGGIILLFTCFSLATLIFMGGEAIDMLSVLFSGLFTFFSLGFQYVLFSAAEWLSDRAKEKNLLSIGTKIFFFAAVLFAVGSAAIGVYATVDSGHNIVTGAHVVLINSLMQYFALMETALFAVFAAYLFSEISFLKLEKIKFAVKLFAFATVLVIAVSELSRVLASAVMSVENENIRSIVSVIGYTNQFVSLVFTVLIAAAIYIGAKNLADNGFAGKWVKVIPIVKIVQSVVFFVLKMVFQSWAATIGDYIVVFIFMIIYVVWLVAGNMKIKKRAEFESEKVTED